MAGAIILAVFGGLIAFGSFISATAVYTSAQSSIHQIYAAVLMLTSVLGLVIMAVSVGAAVITRAIRQADRQAAADRRNLADILRRAAERGSTTGATERRSTTGTTERGSSTGLAVEASDRILSRSV